MKRLLLAALLCLAVPAHAQDIREANQYGGLSFSLTGKAAQGGLLLGKTKPYSTVTANGQPVRVASNGAFLIGFGRDYDKTFLDITVRSPDQSSSETRSIPVLPRVFDIQRVDGLEPKYVEPPPEELKRIQEEQRLIREGRSQRRDASEFEAGFIWPVEGRISGVYGSQRILNGKPRAPHLGVDIAAGRGTVVLATSDGVVTLAHKDLYFNGNVVMIDHGLGLTSVYVHLDEISVTQGQQVQGGQAIGKVGATGRATGPHLHWGVNFAGEYLDPQLLVGPMVQH
ncbi:MAG TPA: M23 family metallopeptidase [Alphaproteobacteria bacterium]|nr:M23 family metallopeptidase [Alphaproteobacteria bacterium]